MEKTGVADPATPAAEGFGRVRLWRRRRGGTAEEDGCSGEVLCPAPSCRASTPVAGSTSTLGSVRSGWTASGPWRHHRVRVLDAPSQVRLCWMTLVRKR